MKPETRLKILKEKLADAKQEQIDIEKRYDEISRMKIENDYRWKQCWPRIEALEKKIKSLTTVKV